MAGPLRARQEASSILQSPLEQPPSPKKQTKKKADSENDTHTPLPSRGGHGHMTRAATATGRGSGPGEERLLMETWTYLGGKEAEQPGD